MNNQKATALLLCLALLLGVGGCGGGSTGGALTPFDPPHGGHPVQVSVPPTPVPTPTPPTVATLAVCGDTMSHMPVTNDAWDPVTKTYDYTPIMSGAQPYIQAADYAVVNLETVLGGGPKYSGYPQFNAPDALAYGLKEVGFDLALTANNHSLDQGHKGLLRTLDVLDEAGLAHVGTNREGVKAEPVVADVGGISVAFLGYTYGTNGIPLPKADSGCVNLFNTDYLTNLKAPDTDRLVTDLAAAKATGADLVAVMIHWGVEYQIKENAYQEKIADLLIANGADLVLGGHAHVPQPIEMRTVTTADDETRQGFVCYSLGNFFSSQYMEYCDTTAVLTLTLEKDTAAGTTRLTGWEYVPMLVVNRGGKAERRFELLDVDKALAAAPDKSLKAKLEKAKNDCLSILGPQKVASNLLETAQPQQPEPQA